MKPQVTDGFCVPMGVDDRCTTRRLLWFSGDPVR